MTEFWQCLWREAGAWWAWFQQYAGGPIMVGLIVAFWLPRANQRYQGRREHLSKAVDTLRAQLEALRKVTTTYWLADYDANTSPAQEGEIEFLLQDIGGLVNACAPYLWRDAKSRGPELVQALMAVAGGAAFGSKRRKAQPGRIQKIALAAAEISREVVAARRTYLH